SLLLCRLVLVLSLIGGCSSQRAAALDSAAAKAPPLPVTQTVEVERPFNASEIAARIERMEDCEPVARSYRIASADRAWAVLKACILRQPRFTRLADLVREPWLQELQTRRDAGPLLAQVIAMRGGDIPTDLGLLHEKRIPLFG